MPTGDAACPVGCVAVDFLAQVQKRLVAGTVVEPVNAGEVVTGPLVLPEGQQKIFVGNGQLPVEIPGHKFNDALITGILVVRLQDVEHNHIGPYVGLAATDALKVGARPEVAVVALAGYHRFEPRAGLVNDSLIAQHVSHVAEAFEPVRHLFPGAVSLAFRAKPGVVLLFEEPADFEQVSGEAIGLQLKLFADPALGFDCAYRQLHKGAWRQRRTVAYVEVVRRPGVRLFDNADALTGATAEPREANSQHYTK